MKIMHLSFFIIIATVLPVIIFIVSSNVYATEDITAPTSSTPENVGTGQFHYTNNTQQSLFIIPVIIAIITIVVGLAIYSGTKSIKK